MSTVRIETIGGETGKAIANVIRAALTEGTPIIVGAIEIDQPLMAWGGRPVGPHFANVQVSINLTGEQVAEILRLATGGVE